MKKLLLFSGLVGVVGNLLSVPMHQEYGMDRNFRDGDFPQEYYLRGGKYDEPTVDRERFGYPYRIGRIWSTPPRPKLTPKSGILKNGDFYTDSTVPNTARISGSSSDDANNSSEAIGGVKTCGCYSGYNDIKYLVTRYNDCCHACSNAFSNFDYYNAWNWGVTTDLTGPSTKFCNSNQLGDNRINTTQALCGDKGATC